MRLMIQTCEWVRPDMNTLNFALLPSIELSILPTLFANTTKGRRISGNTTFFLVDLKLSRAKRRKEDDLSCCSVLHTFLSPLRKDERVPNAVIVTFLT